MYPPSREDVVRGALSPNTVAHHYLTAFRYPLHGGFSSYLKAVASPAEVRLGADVVRIDPRRRRLDFSDGVSASYEHLVSSAPLPELIRMMEGVPSAVREAAEKLVCTSLVLVNVGVPRTEGFPSAHWMYFYDEELSFSRGHFPHLLSPNNAPQGSGSLQMEIYHSPYKPLPSGDVIDKCMHDLVRTGLLVEGEKIDVVTKREVRYANVLFDLDRERSVNIVRSYLGELGVQLCGRYGEWEYHWTDDCVLSGRGAADRVLTARAA
jgi:protoporphyrinogen oxidase